MDRTTVNKYIKRFLPLSAQDFLRPYYRKVLQFLRPQQETLGIGCNWDLEYNVPVSQRHQYKKSILNGMVGSVAKTHYTNILLCAQPKSASLYMADLISLSLGYFNHGIGFDRKQGLIYYPRLLAAKYIRGNTISHCHAEASPQTIQLIKTLEFRPLILTRNLLDTIVSRRDMLVRDKWAGNILSKGAIEEFLNGTDEYQLDVIIDLFANSYINFKVGWEQYRRDLDIKPIFITYQELIDDEPGLISKVAEHLGVEVPPEHVRMVSAKIRDAGGINFSQGISGRGKSILKDRHISELRRKAAMLGCVNEDFLGFVL